MSLCLCVCDVVSHFDLITCHLLVSFFHNLIWIWYPFMIWYDLFSFCLFVPWLDMDYSVYLLFVLQWLNMDCYGLYLLSMTWHGLCYYLSPIIPWLDMDYFAFIFYYLPPMTWYGLLLLFFYHDLIWLPLWILALFSP